MQFDRSDLFKNEKHLYDRMLKHREQMNYHASETNRLREHLIVHIHRRCSYAVERIRSLLGVSRYFVKEEIRRLRQQGRLNQ